jgi:hypothetical protein
MNGWHWLILVARAASWCAHAALSCAFLLWAVAARQGTDKPKAIIWGALLASSDANGPVDDPMEKDAFLVSSRNDR